MKSLSKYSVLISTLVLCGLLFIFLSNLRPKFKEVESNYSNRLAVNLSKELSSKELSDILLSNNYVANQREANLIADTITARLYRGLEYPNLYYLQKRAYGKIPALVADSLNIFRTKLERSKQALGQNALLPPIDSMEHSCSLQKGEGSIEVQLFSDSEFELANAVVFLTEYYYDSLHNACADTIAYAKTDSLGVVFFSGLNKDHGYSVIPIKKGFEYGSSKGIRVGKFKKNTTFRFEQLEHRIQMIDNATLKQIKNDGTITVRTPKEYKAEVIKWFVLVILAWWVLAVFLMRRKKYFDPLLIAAAMFLTGLCVIMMFAIQNPLTEELRGAEMASGVLIGIAIVFALQFVDFIKFYQGNSKINFDPTISVLRWLFLPFKQKISPLATVLSGDARIYKKIGALFLIALSFPFAILRSLFLPYRQKVSYLSSILSGDEHLLKKIGAFFLIVLSFPFVIFNVFTVVSKLNKPILRFIDKLPKGFGWLLLAIILTALLFTPLGKDIGGMTVNLDLKIIPVFQPSEIAKYLIVFFMAAFFTSTADSIIAYSRPNHTKVWNKFKTLAWLLVGLVVIMTIYAVLGDMGPALIIAVTFILLYSLVKSKVNLDNMPEEEKWERIFTCDFAILIYGILSFALFTYFGYKIGNSMIFSLLWFVVWIGVGLSRNKQFFETAFFFNLIVFIFIFGGEILTQIPAFENSDTAIRFEQRTRMCVNTWGDLDILHNGHDAEPVSNTQVANGLWAIATGGMIGQGLGDGNPNLIPAFHTDMILSSIAEQMGWIGLVFVVLVLALLLRRMVVAGYRVGHPFAFYFCMGVAIVTAVQFFIIALGSSGMIPLTGVTVPFISYGKVSMILNLVAFGIVLSMSKNIRLERESEHSPIIEKIRKRSVGDYNYPVSIVSWTFLILALFTLGVWQYYALWTRSKTLVHPAYVLNNQGLPLIEYNPRIALLTREMWAGNIYDRNGILLATSDREKLTDDFIELLQSGINRDDKHNMLKLDSIKNEYEKNRKARTRRYYPFAEQLFFMLGDQNTGLYFTYDENNPIGYMAEAQHLSYLRDYDNTYYDKQGNPVKVNLKGKIKSNARYILTESIDTTVTYRLRDNKALVKYLKTGIQGRPFRKHNKDVRDGDFDLHLTMDAKLQTNLQNRMNSYVKETPALNSNNLLRVSVVVLDAENGELLTSANYPLPDYQRLRDEDSQGHHNYSDNYKDHSWNTYTDRDLGLTFQTMPGSTAKIMSAMAGFQKLSTSASDKKYLITADDIVETGKDPEPHGYKVPMKDAVVYSSNCYFINLINENDLYWELDSVYETAGVSIGNSTPYYLSYAREEVKQKTIREKIRQNESKALSKYNKRLEDGVHKKMNEGEWKWAWGQGYENFELQASPLNMARIASAVVNGGEMPYTQYLLPTNKYSKKHIQTGEVRLLSSQSASILKEYMLAESANQKPRNSVVLPSFVGGKTGTPERYRIDRDIRFYNKWTRSYQTRKHIEKRNDGWYMFFVEGQGEKHPLAVAVRMERSTGSGAAVRLTKSVVLEALYENGYINK